ncbi:hypothetical protein BS47DRAFT_1367032 [Hydnum rufescens UP504]|uniref:Uncharacterized protein n=1 Tax=Hydnum rufescens UP504 TaxID=1448309 RepID=A0A9P6AK71_9AGAM|nr:hypothetical protein BS47DRAFT_1367032 [Hydnum rufescens UP504]
MHGPPARSQCIEREDFSLPSVYRNVDSALSNDDSYVYSKSNNAILHWFPLADEVVEPTSPSTSHNSQSTLCLPPLHPIMSKHMRMPRQNPHMAIPHYVPSSQHEDILYHATTHECVAIPPRLCSMECYREVTQCLDKLVNQYTDPFSSAPITTYQFLMVWTKFAPTQYNQMYFIYDEEQREWHMDRELLITVQTGIERLQNVISDVIAIVGEEDHRFVIDCEGKLTEQLWMSKRIEELRMADKLLKLHIELTFMRLYKLRKLHQGETLSMPMASEDSLPPTPELRDRLHKAWHDPHLPMKKVARRALATGWEAIQGDIEGTRPIITAMRHLFSGNQVSKFAKYDMNLEEVLNMQPLPRVNSDPHGLGLFVPGSEFEEPSISVSLGPDQGPRAGLGSIINLPAWPTPPSDQTRLGNSSALQASSIDLDASPSNWQDIPLYDSTPRESATPMQHPRNKLAAISQQVSTLGEGLQNALWTPSRSQVANREPMGSWEMSPIGEHTMGRHPSGDPLMLQPAGLSCAHSPFTNYLIRRANSTGEGDKYPGHAWNSVTDTPALPAPGATRAHDYYTNIVKMEPFSLSHTLFPCNPTSMPLSKPGSQHTAPMPSQGSSQKESPGPPMEDSKDKGPLPLPPLAHRARTKVEAGLQVMAASLGEEEVQEGEAQGEAASPRSTS